MATPDFPDSFETKRFKYSVLFVTGGLILMLIASILLDDSEDYTLITRDTEVSGFISNIDRRHGMLLFNIQDTLKYKVSGHLKNVKSSRVDLISFLSGGDWLQKKRGTDSLLIIRQENVWRSDSCVFVLQQEYQ